MQIISGKYKHKKFSSPNDSKTHPMGSREKLALFNSLAGKIQGKTVLDAFAGTGALGLEALSHGAKFAVFIEKDPKIAKILEKNLENVLKTEKEELTKLVITGVEDFCPTEKFDLIFADPPYEFYSEALLRPLVGFLSQTGLLCLSIPKSAQIPDFEGFAGLKLLSRKNYAGAQIIIFQKF